METGAWRIAGQGVGRGLLAGALATVPMSGVMAAGRLMGLLQTPPPEEITANAVTAAATTASAAAPTDDAPGRGVLSVSALLAPDAAPPAFHAGWIAAHIVYGALCGALFVGVRACVPGAPRYALGLGYGALVWLGSYLGLLPAMRLYPRPEADSPSRVVTMILAHLVFGVTLAEFERQLAGHRLLLHHR